MNDAFIRIAVTGVTGRMGKEIIKYLIAVREGIGVLGVCNSSIALGAAVTRANSAICGTDIGIFMQKNAVGIIITDDLESIRNDFDVLVDFTAPDISMEYLKFCTNNRKNMVIGTTGFKEAHKKLIIRASKKIGIVLSSNFSIGIALMAQLLCRITQILGNVADISILEAHHNKKRDIPSGTALMMQKIITSALQFIQSNQRVDRSSNTTTCSLDSTYCCENILIHSIRAGDIIGEHTVLFACSGERIEITHKASDRVIFAHGALRSAIWLGCNKVGLFDIGDTLGINM